MLRYMTCIVIKSLEFGLMYNYRWRITGLGTRQEFVHVGEALIDRYNYWMR